MREASLGPIGVCGAIPKKPGGNACAFVGAARKTVISREARSKCGCFIAF